MSLRTNVLLLGVALLSATALSCSSSSTTNCPLSATSTVAPADVSVQYSASRISGDGVISSLTYQGVEKPVTVLSPTLPFSATLIVKKGMPIGISAAGTLNSGTLSISYEFTNPGGTPQQTQAVCGQ